MERVLVIINVDEATFNPETDVDIFEDINEFAYEYDLSGEDIRHLELYGYLDGKDHYSEYEAYIERGADTLTGRWELLWTDF